MATLVAFKPGASTPSTETPDPKHLLRVIEKQPGCLMRVGLDGLLLAVNEAALQLLGASELSQVVGTRLNKLILPRHHEQWDELAARVRDGAAASLECELTDLTGMRRTILMQAAPLLDHADGIPSMIAVARDSSAPRRLEAALREREVSEELGHLQKQLETGVVRPVEAKPSVETPDVVQQKLLAQHSAELTGLRQTLAEEHQLALLLKDQETRQLQDKHRSELEQALAESKRLGALLEEREAYYRGVVEEHAAAGREARQLQDEHRSELEQVLAESKRLGALLEEREAYHRGVIEEHVAACNEAEQAVAAWLTKHAEIEKVLADQRVKFEALDQNARNIEWLAAIGRAGYEIGRELQTILTAIDARTEFLLTQSQLEAEHRHVVEALRGDAITAASLARQIVLARTATEMESESASGDAGRES